MGSRIALLHLDDAAVGCILFLDELFQLSQQLYLIPCIACRQHQIKQHVGVGPARHDAQIVQRKDVYKRQVRTFGIQNDGDYQALNVNEYKPCLLYTSQLRYRRPCQPCRSH